ncbi:MULTISPECIES: hypothetical protein [unclassified Lentimonas]|uniref:hypothetical protein n=1 Tax=unclassified Lentimonas TaxID=2630993 RepID=UPI001324CB4D|nr:MULTISPECIES: hypothetical protein [unclassified Lentimonas]CAA6677991.1 Unannotated [Lentimonas sp. CC4]CAA6686961.1 Unannotated [Lentimonas sp. CC6]CAA7077677.1 Unannotated [Lentimonas sp. CC4]CAA7168487.1 Unannotated [Lentimonas sp. CC21]CAA7182951.1 Unannotated [Lentimonas sp. CC8]
MSLPHNEQQLGKQLRSRKKRGTVFLVIVATIVVHVLGLGGLAAIKIIEVFNPEPEFEAPPIVEIEIPPPPPPPPPTTKRTQRSLPRPQPLAAQNPQDMSVPAIVMQESDVSFGRGMGDGLGELGGGMVDRVNLSSFGFDRALEGTLKGTLFDFKRDKYAKPVKNLPAMKKSTNMPLIPFFQPTVRKFSDRFDLQQLDRNFYKAEQNLYGSYFIIPFGSAAIAPKSFGVEDEIKPTMIGVHYTGSYKPQKTGTFRLVGRADDVLIVRINGKVVLDGSVVVAGNPNYSAWRQSASQFKKDTEAAMTYFGFKKAFYALTGDWFNLREGVNTDVEIFISEVPGGDFGAYILIEEQGVPGLKIFSTRPLSDQDKAFLERLHPDVKEFLGRED